MQPAHLPPTNAFYWAAILVASTFGTTMGDFVASVLHLGFAGASLFLGSLLAALAWKNKGMRILPPFEERIRYAIRDEMAKKPTLTMTARTLPTGPSSKFYG